MRSSWPVFRTGDYNGSNWRPVEEERLVALLRQQLGAKLSPTFSGLRHPPMFDEERRDANAPGVEVRLFPTWFLVDEPAASGQDGADATPPANEKRRRMVEFSDLTVSNAGKLSYKGDAKKAEVNPIRFVGACTKGHLQDIDWRFLTHRSGDRSCRKPLYWVERGVSSDPSDISVRCTCGASVTLGDLYKPKFLGTCACHSPWLTPRRIAERDMRRRSAAAAAIGDEHLLPSNRDGHLADQGGRPGASDDRGAQDDDRQHPQPAELPRRPARDPANEGGFQGRSRTRRSKARSPRRAAKSAATNVNPRIAEFDHAGERSADDRQRRCGLVLLCRDLAARGLRASAAVGRRSCRTS